MISEIEVVYSDVAQPDQGRIIADNLDTFLIEHGSYLLCVKSRSIDVTRDPNKIFKEEAEILEKRGYKVDQIVRLDPYELDHCIVVGRG
jgi:fibrillarin-like pre-rRNA processing protein